MSQMSDVEQLLATKPWLQQVPRQDLEHYVRVGMMHSLAPGTHAALLVIDVTYGFCGSEGQTREEAGREFPTACGPVAWETMPQIQKIIRMFRTLNLPIVYTYPDPTVQVFTGATGKSRRKVRPPKFHEIPAVIAPQDGEWVMGKPQASALFQTPLQIYLTKQKIDTLVLCGVATSGCIRQTAIDAVSSGYISMVVADCCFDMSYYSHCANLFDLHAKYATVTSLDELRQAMGVQGDPPA
jgi:maleamate amidohydrolase